MWSHNSSKCDQWCGLVTTKPLRVTHLIDWWTTPVEHSLAKQDRCIVIQHKWDETVRFEAGGHWCERSIQSIVDVWRDWRGVNTTPLWGHRQVRGHLSWPPHQKKKKKLLWIPTTSGLYGPYAFFNRIFIPALWDRLFSSKNKGVSIQSTQYLVQCTIQGSWYD